MNKLEQLQRDKNGIGFIKSYPILLQLYTKGFNSNEKNIIELVLSYNDNDQAFKMKYKTIAEIFNIEYQTVKNTIAKLKKLSILSTNHKKNYNGVAGGSSTGLSVDIDYLVSLIQEKSITNQPAQEAAPPVETETTEQETKPFDLRNYGDLICHEYDKAIESGLNINEAAYIDYLNNAFTNGKLTKAEQITSANLQAILKTLVIKPETKKEVEKVLDVPSIDYSVVTPVEELNKLIAKQRGRLTVPQLYKLEAGIESGEITNLDALLDLIYPDRHNQVAERFITKAEMELMIDAKKTKAQSIDDMKAIKIKMNNWFDKNKNVTEAQASQEILLRKNALRPPVTGGNQD